METQAESEKESRGVRERKNKGSKKQGNRKKEKEEGRGNEREKRRDTKENAEQRSHGGGLPVTKTSRGEGRHGDRTVAWRALTASNDSAYMIRERVWIRGGRWMRQRERGRERTNEIGRTGQNDVTQRHIPSP
jgi:hypothetical protein